MARKTKETPSRRAYWQQQITQAAKRYERFYVDGDRVTDRYRMERESGNGDLWKDRYNILYSSTETMRPSLYAQTPKVMAQKRHKDRNNPIVTMATLLLEVSTQYAMEEIEFDDILTNAIEDYTLPGLGQVWLRYEPEFKPMVGADGNPVLDKDGEPVEEVSYEKVGLDHVFWKDFLTGPGRTWQLLPWVARRVFYDQQKAAKRWGRDVAAKLKYSYNSTERDYSKETGEKNVNAQAIIWEIWDKTNKKVIWYSDDYEEDVIEEKDDFLKLRNFWPCPRPLRAVSNTRTMVPKAFYSQYRQQAEELDNLTSRIRYLTEALKVRGVFDGSQETLQTLLDGPGNKMIKVENWQQFAGQGGINGSIQWVPIKEVATVLDQLLKAREICKQEIYEITGYSDIVRGVSKASETLGAQQIKSEWAGARLKSMQKETQRFCRDIVRMMAEIISEHFTEETLMVYAGIDLPEPTEEEQRAAAQAVEAGQMPPPTPGQMIIQQFRQVVALLKKERERCALIGIETDSTLLPDEAKEREDRMQFLSSVGAYLQQAGPMALQYPDMRGLLGAIMMFTIRTFRSSRAVEQEFEAFQKKLSEAPAMPPPGSEGKEKADPEVEKAKIAADAQVEAGKAAALAEKARADLEARKYEVDARTTIEREKMQIEERIRLAELALREREVAVKERQLELDRKQTAFDMAMGQREQEHIEVAENRTADREDKLATAKAKAPAKPKKDG